MRPSGLNFCAALAFSLLFAPAAPAAPKDKKVCISAFVEAQKLRKSGSLVKAREELVTCGQNRCPELVRDKCVGWLPEVEQEIPSVILVAKSSDGADLGDVEVTIDDKPELHHIDGQSIPLDPGEHRFGFRHGSVHRRSAVIITARQKDRRIEVTFDAPEAKSKPDPPKRQKKPLPASVYVLGGVSVVALGSFGYFGVTAIQQRNRLRKDCAPDCSESDKDSVDRKLLIADISLGVAVVSLGAATWIALSRGKSEDVAVHAIPVAGGAKGSVRVAF